MQKFFFQAALKMLSWNLGTYLFHFIEFKTKKFFEARSNSQITPITKGIVIYHGNNNGGNNDY